MNDQIKESIPNVTVTSSKTSAKTKNNKRKKTSRIRGNKKGYQDFKSSKPFGRNFGNTANLALTPELGKLAAAINMGTPTGSPNYFAQGPNFISATDSLDREPGVAANVIYLIPGGISRESTSAINEAARAMQVTIRNKINSNRTQYGKIDLFKLTYAVDNILAWLEFLKTIYAVASCKTNPLNKYYPDMLLRAMQVDPSDTLNLRIQLASYIKLLENRIQTFVVPKVPIFEEDMEAFKHIYCDEDIVKAQILVNIPFYIWKFERYTDSSGIVKSHLVPKIYYKTPGTVNSYHTVQDLINFTEDLLVEIINDDSYAIISADIKHSYEGAAYMYNGSLQETYEIEYSKEYLEKWHNASQFGFAPNGSEISNWIIEDSTSSTLDPYLIFDPLITAANQSSFTSARRGCGNRFIDFYDKDVTYQQIFEATRWMFSLFVDDETNLKLKLKCCGSQLLGWTVLYTYDNTGALKYTICYGTYRFNKSTAGFTLGANDFNVSRILPKWNYAPLMINVLISNSVDVNDVGYLGVVGDLGNYTVIDTRVLENIYNVANYTAMGVQPLLRG